MTRSLDIRITAASEAGFVVYEAGEIVAALSTAAELARWIEDAARDVDGAKQPPAESDPVTMPNVVRAGWLGGGRK